MFIVCLMAVLCDDFYTLTIALETVSATACDRRLRPDNLTSAVAVQGLTDVIRRSWDTRLYDSHACLTSQ